MAQNIGERRPYEYKIFSGIYRDSRIKEIMEVFLKKHRKLQNESEVVKSVRNLIRGEYDN